MAESRKAVIGVLLIVSVLLSLGGIGTALYDFYVGSSAADPTSALFTAGMVTLGIGLAGFGVTAVLTESSPLRVAGLLVCGVGTSLYAVHTVIPGEIGSTVAGGVTIGSWVVATLLLKTAKQRSRGTIDLG